MEKLKTWAKDNHLLNDESIMLGIVLDNPETTSAEECRYDTCFVISKDYCINEDYVCRDKIAGGKYAIFEIEHTAEAVQKAWSEVFDEINKNGCQLDYTKPIIERYASKMVNNHQCELCIPIH